jgi:formylglycine-generating enzyme required for sulfatase activity
MVWIPGGEFLMGSDPKEIDEIWKKFGWLEEWKQYTKRESPKHQVRVDGFWMYQYEVTVAQYRTFCQDTGREMPAEPVWGWQENHPIVNVSWDDATAYCQWAGVRLPTEAEWEYAARGENTGLNRKPHTIFIWGDELPKGQGGYGNFADETFKKQFPEWFICEGYDDGFVYTSPVGSFDPNSLGLYDMAGNVWEWCADWFDENYYAECQKQGTVSNPTGPETGAGRVLRGGSWGADPYYDRVSNRLRLDPRYRIDSAGFRCAKTPPLQK